MPDDIPHDETDRLLASPANAQRLLGAVAELNTHTRTGACTMAERITIYVGEPMAAILAGHDDNRHQRINQVCADYRMMLTSVMPSFGRNEWCAIMDATNGLSVMGGDESSYRFIWAEVADCAGLGEKWGIDAESLARVLRGLSTAELIAVAEVSRAFWANAHLDTDEALKIAGAKITPASEAPDAESPEVGADFFEAAQPAGPLIKKLLGE